MSRFEIFYVDLKDLDVYSSADYFWRKVYADDKKHIYLFQAVEPNGIVKDSLYEMMQGVRKKQPDGSVVYTRPQSELWGSKGWTLWGSKKQCLEKFRTRYFELTGEEPEEKDILLDEK